MIDMTTYLPLLPLLDGIRVEPLALQLVDHHLLFLVLDDEGPVALLEDEARLVGQLQRLGLEHSLEVVLPLLVELEPQLVELFQDVRGGFVPMDRE